MGLQNTEGKAQEAIIKYTLDFSDNINNMMKDDFFCLHYRIEHGTNILLICVIFIHPATYAHNTTLEET
jgi:hypothetical protein